MTDLVLHQRHRTLLPERDRVLARPVVGLRARPHRVVLDIPETRWATWTVEKLPATRVTPVDPLVDPLTVGGYTLRPQPTAGIVYVSPTELSLLDFSLTVARSVRPDGSVAVSGATAYLCVSAADTTDLPRVAVLRKGWDDALRHAAVLQPRASYRAEPRRGLHVAVELPAGSSTEEPLVLTSPMAGTATLTIQLTEAAALAWTAALEQGAAATIPGLVRARTGTPVLSAASLGLQNRTLDTALGRLLAGRGAADIRYVDPQVTVTSRLVVVGGDLLQETSVGLRPRPAGSPAAEVFGPSGGQVEVAVTTQDVSAAAVDWSARVSFTPPAWAPVPSSGTLDATNAWTDMVKPESWFATVMLVAIPVDDRGQPQAVGAAAGAEVQGVLTFTAPYVANGLLTSTFRSDYLEAVTVALPRYPGEPFGDLVLTVFATRDGRGGTAARRLTPEEVNVVVLVRPDATVEIRSALDALPELSAAAGALGVLEGLHAR